MVFRPRRACLGVERVEFGKRIHGGCRFRRTDGKIIEAQMRDETRQPPGQGGCVRIASLRLIHRSRRLVGEAGDDLRRDRLEIGLGFQQADEA